jgi:hypothetical protein
MCSLVIGQGAPISLTFVSNLVIPGILVIFLCIANTCSRSFTIINMLMS